MGLLKLKLNETEMGLLQENHSYASNYNYSLSIIKKDTF